jgi:subtilisin family serine protease
MRKETAVMNKLTIVFVPLVVLSLLLPPVVHAESPSANPTAPSDPTEIYAPQLASIAAQEGEVSVIVELNVSADNTSLTETSTPESQQAAINRTQETLLSHLSTLNARSVTAYSSMPYLAMTVDQATLHALAEDPAVNSITQDLELDPLMMDSSPLLGATTAWDEGFSGEGWSVAILDSGIETTHPFLQDKVVAEACFSTGNGSSATSLCPNGESEQIGPGAGVPCSFGKCYHGTHVAGIAAGKGEEFSGIARDASIISVQVFRARNSGGASSLSARLSDILRAMEHVYELRDSHEIAAINLSLGTQPMTDTAQCDSMSSAMYDIVEKLRSAGIVTVAASGNNGATNGTHFPACLSNVVSVGSTTTSFGAVPGETVSSFSNSAPFLDLLAPGSGITSSVPGGTFSSRQGTSMATPHVVGAWAVMRSANPEASPDDILDLLKTTGVPLTDSRNGVTVPRIQLDAALAALQTTTGEFPVAPTNLNADRDEAGHTMLTWNDNSTTEARYTIERWQNDVSNEWSQIAAVDPDTTTYTDADVQQCVSGYTYRVAAYSADNTYLYSNIASPRSSGCTVVSEARSTRVFLPAILR